MLQGQAFLRSSGQGGTTSNCKASVQLAEHSTASTLKNPYIFQGWRTVKRSCSLAEWKRTLVVPSTSQWESRYTPSLSGVPHHGCTYPALADTTLPILVGTGRPVAQGTQATALVPPVNPTTMLLGTEIFREDWHTQGL